MDDNPLEEWLRRREAQRRRFVGRLRAVPLGEGPHRGAHTNPQAPRVIQRHNGDGWETISIVDNWAAAQRILNPGVPDESGEQRTEWDRPPLGKGTGRHRKPSPSAPEH